MKPTKTPTKPVTREDRAAAALRENLRRRKQQQTARDGHQASETPNDKQG